MIPPPKYDLAPNEPGMSLYIPSLLHLLSNSQLLSHQLVDYMVVVCLCVPRFLNLTISSSPHVVTRFPLKISFMAHTKVNPSSPGIIFSFCGGGKKWNPAVQEAELDSFSIINK